jgi:hypothetical protein
MARETTHAKALRYLIAGKLRVIRVTPDEITAVITGDTGTYRLGWHRRVRGGWYCMCPAYTPACCHLIALKVVVTVPSLAGAAA